MHHKCVFLEFSNAKEQIKDSPLNLFELLE